MIYILITLYLIFLFFQIRIFILKKSIHTFVLKAYQLNEYFIQKSKKDLENENYETLMELHYNTCLTNIYVNKIEKNNKIFFNLKQEKLNMYNSLFNIYNISENKDYRIDYFLEDINILKTKDKKNQLLRLKTMYYLLMLNHNTKEINKLFKI